MTLYLLVLILHVTAVFILFAALSFEVLFLFHLRRATTLAEARPWIEPVPRLSLFAVASLLVILFSGVYLVIPIATPGQAWPKVAVTALLLMGPFGAITARRMRAIRTACGGAKAISPELLNQLQDRSLKISLGIRIATFLGIFVLVSVKPGLWQSISLVGSSMALGLLSSFLVWHHSASVLEPGGAGNPTR